MPEETRPFRPAIELLTAVGAARLRKVFFLLSTKPPLTPDVMYIWWY